MRLCLGTVQFGMKYGVKNALGRQPTDDEIFAVLDAALAAGIVAYDTASAYGTSEDVLGRYGLSAKYVGNMPVRITSKLRPDLPDDAESVVQEVRKTLRRLHADRLHCYMLHRATDMEQAGIMEGLMRAKKAGLVEHIGVSIYEPEEALRAAKDSHIEHIQVPYNVLDHRLDVAGFFDIARTNGKRIYARSTFLQGLLLMSPADAEAHVTGSGTYIADFQRIAHEKGFSPGEAALLYALSHEGIDHIVFGVDTVEQLRENASTVKKLAQFRDCRRALADQSESVPETVVAPTKWSKR